MYASSCAFTVVDCIRISKSCTSFTSPKLFCWSRGKRYPLGFLYIISWFWTIKKNLPWNNPLAQLKITVINKAIQLKFSFRVMFVIRNRISKITYFLSLFVFFYILILFHFSYFYLVTTIMPTISYMNVVSRPKVQAVSPV